MEETNLFTTFPDSGLYALPVGKNHFDIIKGILKDANGVIVPIIKHASKDDPLKHLWIYCDNDVNAEIRYNGVTQYKGRVASSGFNFQDITYDEFTIITTEATDVQVIGSTSDTAQVGFSVEGSGDVELVGSDIDTKDGLVTNSLIYGQVSAGVTVPVNVDASGNLILGADRPILPINGDTYFTDALVTGASENEDITITSDTIKIKDITIYCIQSLNFRLWFYTTDAYGANDVIGYIDLDIITNGVPKIIGATTFYFYSVVGVNIPYEDLDASLELHMQLENRSVVAKNAGATGKVQITVAYEVI